ncbi:efflux RND transporter periplasmic adaptor subunit [Caballeronia sp. NK8]|uniref:efflux RND transporter periplasmic adaptor subunit n=1 Tax=Caballeronia sp. NK8 TaxID=140098 RepID=UPI001BB6A241|nr:efflux RND transporter periplasmic adaptor subunit [Caballeronia sp. NK8]BCQ26875.1 efflux RND transporter periplasmic adaptor subunit [Caballeronia sp. NK8]
MNKRLILLLAAILVAGGAWGLLHARGARPDASEAADILPEVSVAHGVIRDVDETDHFTGHLQATDTVQLRPRVNGYINSVHFQEGTLVKKNQLLFQIDPGPYQAEVNRISANLVQARAELALAQANASRAERLLEQHAVSHEEAERLVTAAQSAKAQVAATVAALTAAQLNLGYTQVRAPIDGRVGNALITKGNLVTSSDVLASVVSVNPIFAYFDVDEQAYLRLLRAHGQEVGKAAGVQVAMALLDETGYQHPGRVDFVDNQLRTSSGTIRLRAVFDNADGAYTPGLYVRLRLDGGKRQSTMLVDDRAIGTDLSNKFVFVVDADHKVNYRRVEIGPLFAGLRVIKDGLRRDDLIVVNGIQRVRPGIKVTSVPVTMTVNLAKADQAEIEATAKPPVASSVLAKVSAPAEVRKQ